MKYTSEQIACTIGMMIIILGIGWFVVPFIAQLGTNVLLAWLVWLQIWKMGE